MHCDTLPSLLDIDLPAELWRLVAQVPRGRVTTYGTLAAALGDRVAARWVGEALLDHEHGPTCSCHRVVRKDGEPGLFIAGDSATKLAKLGAEGVPIRDGRASLAALVADFDSPAPLRRLQEFQRSVPGRLDLRTWDGPVDVVAALDVAYLSPREAIGACVLYDATQELRIDQHTVQMPVTFPYVSGYLTFRELPVLWELWQGVIGDGFAPDVVLIDGNGILHPRRAGIAACFGLLADVPTIGVGKTLLCGSVDRNGMQIGESRPIMESDELVGFAVCAARKARPIFVSPGNHCDVKQAAEIVLDLCFLNRLPLPLHLADRLTKQRVRELRSDTAGS